MKKTILGFLAAASLLVVGCRYDDSDLQTRVSNLEDAVITLQGLQGQIDALKSLVGGSASGLVITKYEETSDHNGWTITLSNGDTFTILNGQAGVPGAPGSVPSITVDLNDGVYCWKVNGEWLTGSDGKPLPVTGTPVTPQFQIKDNVWQVSVDGGKTWSDCGGAVADALFQSVVPDEEKGIVTFTLTDGTVIVLPIDRPFTLVFPKYKGIGIEAGSTVELEYTVSGADADTEVDVMAVTAGYEAVVVAKDAASGVVKVTAPDPIAPGKVLVWADNGKGKSSIKALTFEGGVAPTYEVTIGDVDAIEPNGETVEISVTSNMVYEVVIEKTAEDWIHFIQTKAVETKTLVFQLDRNNTGETRTGSVEIVGADGTVYQTITFVQEPAANVAELTRVWGYFNAVDNTWDDEIAPGANWNRNGTIAGKYIYIPVINNKTVAVFDINGKHVSDITGFSGGGSWTVATAAKLGDAVYISGSGGNAAWISGDLTIYKLTNPDADGRYTGFEVAAVVPQADIDGHRFGDKMTAFGTDEEGVLMFVDYAAYAEGTQCRGNLQFHVQNGIVDAKPISAKYLDTKDNTVMMGIYILQGGPGKAQLALYAGNQINTRAIVLDGWLNADGGWWNTKLPDDSYGLLPIFDHPVIDPRLVTFGDQDYLAYVTVHSDANTGVAASFRLVALPDGDNIHTRLFNIKDLEAASKIYPLVDPEDVSARSGASSNTTGYCEVSEVDGVLYILAGATEGGMSLFTTGTPAQGAVSGPGDATVVPGGDF